MSETEANALVDAYRQSEYVLVAWTTAYKDVDFLGHPETQRLVAARDNARNALVAALTGGAS